MKRIRKNKHKRVGEDAKALRELMEILCDEVHNVGNLIRECLFDEDTNTVTQKHFLSLTRRLTKAFTDTIDDAETELFEITVDNGTKNT